MLTSPVNVTIAAASGAALKANTAASDNTARREHAPLPVLPGLPAEMVIEPELPSNSPINHVNAVAATVGNRTILQELSLNVAIMLRIPRRPDENLTALFLRIIAAIETMPQAERLQFEMRAGLKPLKITLADLVMALRKPDGQEAARLTAMAEAPAAVPGRTAATAATSTYLQEGTRTGHTEETLAMRAAARNSAAGQSVFSAENKMRAEAPPADAKVLQNQLKSLFEPGETRRAPAKEAVSVPQAVVHSSTEKAVAPEVKQALPLPTADSHEAGSRENVAISSASLKLDEPTLDKIRNAAQAIASPTPEITRADPDRPAADKAEAGDRRVQTLLTLKGFAEAVTAIPAKAAELLASMVAEVAAPLVSPTDAGEGPDRVTVPLPLQAFDEAEVPEFTAPSDELVTDSTVEFITTNDVVTEALPEAGIPTDEPIEEQVEATIAEDHQAAVIDKPPLPRSDLTQHGVPFAHVQVQPAREELVEAVPEEDARDEAGDDNEEGGDEAGERRRPRDEYDAIHDVVPEDEPVIIINRDSSEADRAFALYQRMGGF